MADRAKLSAEPAGVCPLCGKDNGCAGAAGLSHTSCWCVGEEFPREILEQMPQELVGKRCICKECLDAFKRRMIR